MNDAARLPADRFRNTIYLTLLTAAGHLVYLLQGICISKYFGTSAQLDGFWLALLVVTTLVALAEPFKEAVMVGVKVQELSDPAESRRTLCGILNHLVLWSLAVIAVVALGARSLAAFLSPDGAGTPAAKAIQWMILLLLPLCVIQAVGILVEGYLAIQRRYLVPRFCAMVGLLAGLWALIQFHQWLALKALVLALYLTFGLKLTAMIWPLRRSGFRYSLSLRVRGMRGIGGQFVPLLLVQLSAMFMLFLFQKFLSAAAPGGLSAYNFAYTLWVVPLMLLAASVATVTWTDMIEAGHLDLERLWADFYSLARLTCVALFGCSLLFLVLAGPIIGFIYQRGAFTTASTDLTALCLRALAIGLPFWGLVTLSVRGLLARRMNAQILVIGLAQNGLTALGILLAHHSGLGMAAMILIYVAGNVLASIAYMIVLYAGAGWPRIGRLFFAVARVAAALALAAGAYFLIVRLAGTIPLEAPPILRLGMSLATIALTYGVALWVLHEREWARPFVRALRG